MSSPNPHALALQAHGAWTKLISDLDTDVALKVLNLMKETIEDDIRSYEAWDDESAPDEEPTP